LFLTLASGWLGYGVSWQEVYWRGQQWRLKPVLAQAESLAKHLASNWPKEDGDLPQVGPYLAYPKGGPTTILPLHWITFPNTSLWLVARPVRGSSGEPTIARRCHSRAGWTCTTMLVVSSGSRRAGF
jgi:hypothetical protein